MTSEITSRAFSEAIELAIPPPLIKGAEWADRFRVVSKGSSSRPGPWRTDLVPYTRDIMDAACAPEINEIVWVACRQVAKTETILNIIGRRIHVEPVPQFYACEDEGKFNEWSKKRFAPMLRDTPVLRALVRDARIRGSDNTIQAKSYPGGFLMGGWATSSNTATSFAVAAEYFDERDAYKETDLGDYCKVAEPMMDTWRPDTLSVKISTPGDRLENPPGTPIDAPKFSPIEREYHESDQRRYYVPCPHCGEFQTLKFANLKWGEDPSAAYYVCGDYTTETTASGKEKIKRIRGCGAVIEHRHKTKMLARGEWRQENKNGPRVKGRAGFHLNKLYSPFVTWGQMAEAFVAAKRSGDPGQLKAFVTMWLAEGWEPPEPKIETSEIVDRREDYGAPNDEGGYDPIPVGVCLIVAGVDVHPDRLEAEIVGFGLNFESWSLDYVVVFGDPTKGSTWEELKREVVTREFARADGVTLKVQCTAIDSAGGFTNEVYKFAYANRGYRVFPVKGWAVTGKPIVGQPTWQGRPKVKLFMIGTEAAKDTFITNLNLTEPGPGFCHFPLQRSGTQGRIFYGEDHFKQLLSERPKMERGKRVWRKIRESLRNEALDCRVYAMAAFAICFGDGRKMPALHKSLSEQAARIAKKLQAVFETQNDDEAPSDDGDGSDSNNNPPPAPTAPRIPDSGSVRGGFRIPRGRGRY